MPSKGKGRSARKRSAASDDGTKSEKAHGDGASSAKRRNTSPSRKVDAPYSTATRTTRSHTTVSAAASVATKDAIKKKTTPKKTARKTTPSKIVKQKTASKAGKAVAAKKAVTTKKQKGQSAASNKSAVSPQPQNADIHLPIQILPSKSTTTLDSFEVPRRITFKESQKSDYHIYCLVYLRDGRLLSGVYGGINGFITNFRLRLEDVCFFCEYDNRLFVLCYNGRKFRVHVVNVTNHTIKKSVITCKVDGFGGQIAVNEHDIGISGTGTKCVKIFSSKDYSHRYDIKRNVGDYFAFLNNNMVVTDRHKNVVTCATLNSSSEVQWKNTDIAQPYPIRVCSQVLLIGAADSHQIYALSHEGQTLSVFDLPECSDGIKGIAVFGKQLAVFNGSEPINVYEIEDNE